MGEGDDFFITNTKTQFAQLHFCVLSSLCPASYHHISALSFFALQAPQHGNFFVLQAYYYNSDGSLYYYYYNSIWREPWLILLLLQFWREPLLLLLQFYLTGASTNTTTITVIWPDGATATRNGVKIREWVEGHGSGVWSDNVFEITGNWTTTFVNGNTHSYTVLTPLRREVICFYFVSGSIDVVRTNFSGVFDYGDGSCDNLATFTFADGTVVDITLN